jgi:pimeloyl-ACP methyl ester carboxylesterase/DNA-binding CsgD family transcriptional regulator
MPYSNIQLEWDFPAVRSYYEALTRSVRFIRYDCRGAGLSDREVSDYTPEAHCRDILAVADHLGLERFGLLGFGHSGGISMHFAARYPERVSHLLLWCTYPRAADYAHGPRVEAYRTLMDEDWEFWTRAEAFRLSEFEGGDTSNWFVEYIRDSLTEAGSKAAVRELMKVDVTDIMPQVRAPTLVMHRTGLRPITVEMAREIATSIPNARLMLLDGNWIVPFIGGGTEEIVAAIVRFMHETPPPLELPAPVRVITLSPRETEVLRLIAAGRTSNEISRELSLSVRTVGRHITNIYTKIGARTRADATAYALRNRIA